MMMAKVLPCAWSAMLALAVLAPWSGCAAEKDGGFVVYPKTSGSSGPVVFSHRAHGSGKAGYACDTCHGGASTDALKVSMDAIHKDSVCGSCHDGKTKGPRGQTTAAAIQNCSGCHMPAADILIKLNRMDPAVFSHARHMAAEGKVKTSNLAGFSCSDCHPAPYDLQSKGQTVMEVPHESGGCAECHSGKVRSDGMPETFAANTKCLKCHKPPAD